VRTVDQQLGRLTGDLKVVKSEVLELGRWGRHKYSEERKRKRMVVVGLGPLVGDYLLSLFRVHKQKCMYIL
jgi:hypothetical protein